jgi:hypothetical protein
VLKGLLSKTNNPYRFGIARTLWELDPSEANTVRAIVQPYKISRKAGDRIDAASLLWRMDRDPDEVLPTLISLLKDDDTVFDHRTIQLLKQIGPGARDAIPALTEWVAKSADAEPFIINNARLVLQQADKTDQHEMTK